MAVIFTLVIYRLALLEHRCSVGPGIPLSRSSCPPFCLWTSGHTVATALDLAPTATFQAEMYTVYFNILKSKPFSLKDSQNQEKKCGFFHKSQHEIS